MRGFVPSFCNEPLEIYAILKPSDTIECMNGMGAEIMGGTVEVFALYRRPEFEKWTTFRKDAGIKPQ